MNLQGFWDRHPVARETLQVLREGQWVSHVFEWIFMMISRFTGYAMTLAIGYLIYYAIEFKHSLDVTIAHPGFADNLAALSNVIINVGPELVFPGVVVLCIRAFQKRSWLDGALYLITTIAFVILTMVLLNAFMSNQITADFLSAMLFWRAGASLFYTVVAAYAGGHGGLDFRELLGELDTLRESLSTGQLRVSTLEQQLSSVQQQLDGAKQEVSSLKQKLFTEQQKVSSLEQELETGHGDTAGLRRQLNAARDEAQSLRGRLDAKTRELEAMQQDQAGVIAMRRELNTVKLAAEDLRAQLDRKTRELNGVQSALSSEQQTVSSLRRELSTGQGERVSTGQKNRDTGQGERVSTGQKNRDTGQRRLDTSQENIVELDTRRRTPKQTALAVQQLMREEAGISGRDIARRLPCSPTTANEWKKFFDEGGTLEQAFPTEGEAVNE